VKGTKIVETLRCGECGGCVVELVNTRSAGDITDGTAGKLEAFCVGCTGVTEIKATCSLVFKNNERGRMTGGWG